MHAPTTLYWHTVKRNLYSHQGTLAHCLPFSPTNKTSILDFLNVGWVFDADDSHSQYAFTIYYGSNLISWTSQK